MKNYPLIIILAYFSFTCNTFGQGYHRFLKTTDWYEMQADQMGPSPFWYNTMGDTVINSYTYTKITRNIWGTVPIFVREDSLAKKVWAIFPGSANEKLLYDFSLGLGSTVNLEFVFAGTYSFQVTAVDSVNTLAGYRKRLTLFYNEYFPQLHWIQGIGSIESPFYLYDVTLNTDPVYWLICSYESNFQTYFSTSGYACAPIPVSDIEPANQSTREDENIYISSSDQIITVSGKASIKHIELFSMDGRLLASANPGNKTTAELFVENPPCGIYMLRIYSSKGYVYLKKVLI